MRGDVWQAGRGTCGTVPVVEPQPTIGEVASRVQDVGNATTMRLDGGGERIEPQGDGAHVTDAGELHVRSRAGVHAGDEVGGRA